MLWSKSTGTRKIICRKAEIGVDTIVGITEYRAKTVKVKKVVKWKQF